MISVGTDAGKPPYDTDISKIERDSRTVGYIPISGGPGQQLSPNPIRAIPVTRATGIATPLSSSPSNNRETNDGTIRKAKPVAASRIAVRIRTFFIAASGSPCLSKTNNV